jgi:hypothetical protein
MTNCTASPFQVNVTWVWGCGDHDDRPGSRQRVGWAESEAREISPIEFWIQQALPVMPFDFRLQGTQVGNRYDPSLIALFCEH